MVNTKGKSEGGSGSGSIYSNPDSLNSQYVTNSIDVSEVESLKWLEKFMATGRLNL